MILHFEMVVSAGKVADLQRVGMLSILGESSISPCLPAVCSTQAGSLQGSPLDWPLIDPGGTAVAPEGVVR